ncbi:MAG: hypothetical protein FD180_124 [Planctomycetota bacterium]|nr:MAG: hypothetical protein FD180_124 [Planctomycetota bacterium]
MKRTIWAPGLAAAALAAVSLYSPAPASADGSSPAHLTWCSLLTETLRNQTLAGQTTNAAGKALNACINEKVILWVEDGNQYSENRTVCGQHVTVQLKHAYGWSDTYVKAKFGSTSPTAERYYNNIVANQGFVRINNIVDFAPGDIFAMSYKDDPNANYPTVTGHTGIINSVGPMYTYTFTSNGVTIHFRDFEIFDSTSAVHSMDNRIFQAGELGPGSPYTEWTGAGRSYMRLYVDASDNYLGYTWSMTGNKSQPPGTPPSWTYYNNNFKAEAVRHFAVGRVTVP